MYLSRVRPIHKNRVEQSLEDAPFSILLRDNTPSPAAGEHRRALDPRPRNRRVQHHGQGQRGANQPRGGERSLLHVEHWIYEGTGKERRRKSTQALADAQGGKAIAIRNTESRDKQFNLLYSFSFPFQQKRKKKIEKKNKRKKKDWNRPPQSMTI